MSKHYYIFSTLTSPQIYTMTQQGGGDLPETVAEVYIAGGANVPDKYMRTSQGVVTKVTDAEYSILEANEVFQLHKKNGFITVSEKPADPEKVAADMETRDQSAPLVEQDFAEGEAPKVNGPTDDAPKSNKRKA